MEAGTQKDEPVVHARLREELAKWKEEASPWRERAVEYRSAAVESRVAADMVLNHQGTAESLLREASDIMRQTLGQMDEHSNECPYYQKIWMARHGSRWHSNPDCSSLVGRDRQSQRMVERCLLRSQRMLPPDLVDRRDGQSARVLVHQWLDKFEQRIFEI